MTDLLFALTGAHGVAGNEDGAAEAAAKYLEKYGKVRRDRLGSVIAEITPPGPDGEHLLLDAHLDEIGFIITKIDDNGFLRFHPVGGIDPQHLLANEVTVLGTEPIYGLICSKPPHLMSADQHGVPPKADDLFIDIGYSKEEAEKRVSPGDVGHLCGKAAKLLDGQVTSRALDDRACCAIILRALELLGDYRPACGLSVSFSVQEEIGGGGARAAAFAVAPTKCIALDVSFAKSPGVPDHQCGKLYGGPMIGIAASTSRRMARVLESLAKQHEIPYQLEIMGGHTGTNADGIASSREGVETCVLSLPQKYMHSPIEVVAIEDIENSARLLCAYIKHLGGKSND